MGPVLKFIAGAFFLVMGLLCLARPGVVFRMNAWAREFLFNDAFVLHYRRRWGLLFMLLAIPFFYSAFMNFWARSESAEVSVYLKINAAHRAVQLKDYSQAVRIIQEVLYKEPDHIHARALLKKIQTDVRLKHVLSDAPAKDPSP